MLKKIISHRRIVTMTCLLGIVVGLVCGALIFFEDQPAIEEKNNIEVGSSKSVLDLQKSHFDASGHFKINPYVVTARHWTQLSQDESSVCVAVQTSLDWAGAMTDVTAGWRGPISLALYAPGAQFTVALAFLSFLRRCSPYIRDQVSAHLVYPAENPPLELAHFTSNVEEIATAASCSLKPSVVLKKLLKLANFSDSSSSFEYPQNVLRNVAKEHCQTLWVTVLDIDMLFPPLSSNERLGGDASERLSAFLSSPAARECNQCAFVIPVYEIRTGAGAPLRLPANKKELMKLIKRQQARRYHERYFAPNQHLSQLQRWEALPPKDNEVNIAFHVPDFEFFYEPIYVARRGTPRFDERYIGYGMVRNTQVYEMHLAAYRFVVLDGLFLNHWGFKEPSSKNANSPRSKQTSRNFKLFCNTHLQELKARYNQRSSPRGLHCK